METSQVEGPDANLNNPLLGLDASDDPADTSSVEPTDSPDAASTSSATSTEDPAAQTTVPDDRAEMLSLLRDMRQQVALTNDRNNRLERELNQLRKTRTVQAQPTGDDEDPLNALGDRATKPAQSTEEPEPVALGEIEQLHQDLREVGAARGDQLTLLAETMSFTPEYKDLYEVCSRSNMSTLVDAMADVMVAENGGSKEVAALQIENAIWRRQNPYKWMYGKIKEMQTAMQPEPEGDKANLSTEGGRQPAATKANPTIVDKPGSDAGSPGWTAAKLDAMSEEDLIKVPSDIRQLWLSGELK